MTRRVIFLDIDGVLNRLRDGHIVGGNRDYLEPALVKRCSNLIEDTGAYVVISSSWRLFHNLADLKQQLQRAGFVPVQRIIDSTPSEPKTRAGEIRAWLAAHPEVERYAVLDDDTSEDGSLADLPRWVRVLPERGLSKMNVYQAMRLLEGTY